jgi:hypothetical protein
LWDRGARAEWARDGTSHLLDGFEMGEVFLREGVSLAGYTFFGRSVFTSSISSMPCCVNGLGRISFMPSRSSLVYERYIKRDGHTRRVVRHDIIRFRVTCHRNDRRHMVKLPDQRCSRYAIQFRHNNILRYQQRQPQLDR